MVPPPGTRKAPTGLAMLFALITLFSHLVLSSITSGQAAELVARTEACRVAEGQSVTIYTDSRYAWGVVHDFGALWRHRKFLKSNGKPVLNHLLITQLLDAILLPTQVAVCKCAAHTNATDSVSKCNAAADTATNAATLKHPSLTALHGISMTTLSPAFLTDMQAFASPQERRQWKCCGHDMPGRRLSKTDHLL